MVELRRRNLSSLVADELLQSIRSGNLRPGDRLPTEQGLMDEFQVGRNVIREAVQQLVALGVVDVRPRRGIVVSEHGPTSALDALAVGALLDDRTVDELYSFRMILETAIAEQAARQATPDDIERINASLRRYENAVERRSQIWAADVEFHQQLAEASGNVVFTRVLAALGDLLELYRRVTDRVPGAPEQAVIEHTAIVKAIEARDTEAARRAMESHLHTAMQSVAEGLSMQLQTLPSPADRGPSAPDHD
jgi:DNA-binding FadR family transcriptional regulator